MKQRLLGRTYIKVSEIGFGGWAIGGNAYGDAYGYTEDDASLGAIARALELGYRKPATLYNLACTHAQLREKDKAFGFLFQAIDAGYDSLDHIRHDEDLDPLRRDSRFRKALERAKGRKNDAED